MLSVNGFRAALRYLTMFKEGMICTVSLSFLTVVFGFLLALVLALMRMSALASEHFRFHLCGGVPRDADARAAVHHLLYRFRRRIAAVVQAVRLHSL